MLGRQLQSQTTMYKGARDVSEHVHWSNQEVHGWEPTKVMARPQSNLEVSVERMAKTKGEKPTKQYLTQEKKALQKSNLNNTLLLVLGVGPINL